MYPTTILDAARSRTREVASAARSDRGEGPAGLVAAIAVSCAIAAAIIPLAGGFSATVVNAASGWITGLF